MVLAQGLGISSMSGVVRYVRNVILGTFCVEGAGALILFFRFLPEFGVGKALWYGVFHSISAFCNAGFDILADVSYGGSIARYATDPVDKPHADGADRDRRPRLYGLGRDSP